MPAPANTYAHGHSAATLSAHAARGAAACAAHLLPHLAPGLAVLDIGCGPGSITADLAALVAPGRVVGLDSAAPAIAAARAAHADRGLGNLDFVEGDLFALPFPDATFDVVHSHQVVAHLPAAKGAAALAEARRVLKPGGLLAAREAQPGHGAVQVYPYDPALARTFDVVVGRVEAGGAAARGAAALRTYARAAEFKADDVALRVTLDVSDTAEKRALLAEQWGKRATEDGFVKFARDKGLMSDDELARVPQAWQAWAAHEDAWLALMQVELLAWKREP